jgi:hypothetical protein
MNLNLDGCSWNLRGTHVARAHNGGFKMVDGIGLARPSTFPRLRRAHALLACARTDNI